MNLENKISFLGKRDDIQNIMQAMDIFVFPSLFEGLPVALIEAQASGLSTFASDKVISKKSKMSEYFEFISLDKNEEEWAKIILEKTENTIEREDRKNDIKKAGYDIKAEAKKLEEYFLKR